MNLSFESRLSQGQCTEVWKGLFSQEGEESRPVAIKISNQENKKFFLNVDFFLRYLHQDSAASSWIIHRFAILKHYQGKVALVTELFNSTLQNCLESTLKGLSLEKTALIGKQVAGALAFLDQVGVVYPDLHPKNILLSGNTVKLGNFKQAYFKEGVLSNSLTVKSTYMSPDFVLGYPFSPAQSIWTLAQIIRQIFTKSIRSLHTDEEFLASLPLLLGTPYPETFIQNGTTKGKEAFEKSLEVELPSVESLKEIIERAALHKKENPGKAQELLDLLLNMLRFQDRISAEEVVLHPFFREIPIDSYVPSFPAEPVLEGQFRNLSYISEGSFGSVYRADLIKDGNVIEPYVLKVSKEDGDSKERLENKESILDEDRFLRYLQKDPRSAEHIIKRHALFSKDNRIYLVLESMKRDLSTFMQERECLSLVALRSYAKQLLEALDFLSEKGVIHLDIKPGNILVSMDEQKVVLADFGAACFEEKACHKRPYQITRWYRGPEVVLEIPFSVACDIWSLATSLSDVFLKQHLFRASSTDDLIHFHENRLGKYPASLLNQAPPSGKTKYESKQTQNAPFLVSLGQFIDIHSRGKGERAEDVRSFLSFIRRGLEMDPKNRPSARELLQDPFIVQESSSF